MLTARHERRLQIIRAVIAPRGRGENELYAVDCDVDVLHVIAGRITWVFTAERYELAAGDTISFPVASHIRGINETDEEAVVTWTLVPAAAANGSGRWPLTRAGSAHGSGRRMVRAFTSGPRAQDQQP